MCSVPVFLKLPLEKSQGPIKLSRLKSGRAGFIDVIEVEKELIKVKG